VAVDNCEARALKGTVSVGSTVPALQRSVPTMVWARVISADVDDGVVSGSGAYYMRWP
jgi:hypothetical protein